MEKKTNPNTMFAKVNRIEFEGLGVNKSGQQSNQNLSRDMKGRVN